VWQLHGRFAMRGIRFSMCAALIVGIFAAMLDIGVDRVLGMELLLLLILELLLYACAVLMGWALWKDSREQRAIDAEQQRYGQWCCPSCRRPFGHVETWVYPADGGVDDRGEPFHAHVAFTCPHCRFFNCFDSSGRPMSSRGMLVD
jgi:hypothetical protein